MDYTKSFIFLQSPVCQVVEDADVWGFKPWMHNWITGYWTTKWCHFIPMRNALLEHVPNKVSSFRVNFHDKTVTVIPVQRENVMQENKFFA